MQFIYFTFICCCCCCCFFLLFFLFGVLWWVKHFAVHYHHRMMFCGHKYVIYCLNESFALRMFSTKKKKNHRIFQNKQKTTHTQHCHPKDKNGKCERVIRNCLWHTNNTETTQHNIKPIKQWTEKKQFSTETKKHKLHFYWWVIKICLLLSFRILSCAFAFGCMRSFTHRLRISFRYESLKQIFACGRCRCTKQKRRTTT